MREFLLVERTLNNSCPTYDQNLIANCGYAYINGSLEDRNFSDIHMHTESITQTSEHTRSCL